MENTYKVSKWVKFFQKGKKWAVFNAVTLVTYYSDDDGVELLKSFLTPKSVSKVLIKYKNDPKVKKLIDQYIEGGCLVDSKEKEAENYKEKIKAVVREKEESFGKKTRLNSFRIVLTEKCNLRCSYCFVQRDVSKLRDMDETTLIKALDLLIKLNGKKDVEVQFFGGEPLIKFDLIQKAVKYLDKKIEEGKLGNVFYGITINGTLLTKEIAKFMAKKNFLVSLSIDGWKEIHDKNRKSAGGVGSFDMVIKALDLLSEAGCETGLLITPNNDNIAVLTKCCEYFVKDLGNKFVTINTPQSVRGNWTIKGKVFSKQLEKIFKIAKKYDAVINSFASRITFALNTNQPQILSCSQFGQNYTATITPDGKISPCIIAWQLGDNVVPINEFSYDGPFKKWKIYKPFSLPECADCEAMGFCGGPCPLELYYAKTSGTGIDRERCKFFHESLKWAIWAK